MHQKSEVFAKFDGLEGTYISGAKKWQEGKVLAVSGEYTSS